MILTMGQIAAIFNEWAKRYADDPSQFGEILWPDGRPVTDYGDCCAAYFNKIADEMHAAGLLPKS